jgi:hypothetical protein
MLKLWEISTQNSTCELTYTYTQIYRGEKNVQVFFKIGKFFPKKHKNL